MELEAEEIAKHLEVLRELDMECRFALPVDYYSTIARHWFDNIGPAKTEEYGVMAWKRLGYRGIAGQLSGCFYRWTRMVSKGMTMADHSMLNAVVDAFGYAMLLHCALDIVEVRLDDTTTLPRLDHETLLTNLWYGDSPDNSEIIALRMAWMMYNGAIE